MIVILKSIFALKLCLAVGKTLNFNAKSMVDSNLIFDEVYQTFNNRHNLKQNVRNGSRSYLLILILIKIWCGKWPLCPWLSHVRIISWRDAVKKYKTECEYTIFDVINNCTHFKYLTRSNGFIELSYERYIIFSKTIKLIQDK